MEIFPIHQISAITLLSVVSANFSSAGCGHKLKCSSLWRQQALSTEGNVSGAVKLTYDKNHPCPRWYSAGSSHVDQSIQFLKEGDIRSWRWTSKRSFQVDYAFWHWGEIRLSSGLEELVWLVLKRSPISWTYFRLHNNMFETSSKGRAISLEGDSPNKEYIAIFVHLGQSKHVVVVWVVNKVSFSYFP